MTSVLTQEPLEYSVFNWVDTLLNRSRMGQLAQGGGIPFELLHPAAYKAVVCLGKTHTSSEAVWEALRHAQRVLSCVCCTFVPSLSITSEKILGLSHACTGPVPQHSLHVFITSPLPADLGRGARGSLKWPHGLDFGKVLCLWRRNTQC